MSNLIGYILVKIWVGINPKFWFSNYGVNEEWDAAIRGALKSPKFSNSGRYTIILNGTEIWKSNYPYSYGYSKDMMFSNCAKLPSKSTRWYLKRAIDKYERELLSSIT